MPTHRSFRLAALVLAVVQPAALGAPALAASPPGPSMADALAAIRAYAPAAMAQQGTPGLSVAITGRDRTLATIALGYANVDAKRPVTPETRFAIGSITKSMTALSVLQLSDAGKVDLDAPVTRYLPWFSIDSSGQPILIRELLSHTAGLPDDYAFADGYVYDILALRNAKTLFTPGTSWSYSNDGFATLGAMVAAVDGRTWIDALTARVLGPIGMRDSTPFFTPAAMTNAATGYEFLDNDRPPSLHPALVAAPPFDFVDPAGSVLSTPEDMARYMRLYLNGGKTSDGRQLVSPAAFAAMTRAATLADGKPAGSPGVELSEAPAFYKQYGYGLSIFDDGGDRVIGHTGGISGYTACMQMNLTRGFGVIAFANLVEAPLHPCAIVLYAMKVLRAQSLGEALPAPPAAPDPSIVAHAADYAGTYTGADRATLRVAAAGEHLFLVDGTRRLALYPRDTDLFWVDDPHYAEFLLAFGRDAQGKVDAMNYGSHWYAGERYRGPRSPAYPPAWNALAGRYESTFAGETDVTRVVLVNGRLTLDGVARLRPRKDGTYALGDSTVRFDSYAGAVPQRLWIDSIALYRVELP